MCVPGDDRLDSDCGSKCHYANYSFSFSITHPPIFKDINDTTIVLHNA